MLHYLHNNITYITYIKVVITLRCDTYVSHLKVIQPDENLKQTEYKVLSIINLLTSKYTLLRSIYYHATTSNLLEVLKT